MDTLLLDTVLWDLVADISGNIAVATNPYSEAQDVTSACKLFLSEQMYDTTKGVPYMQSILGKNPSNSEVTYFLTEAALTVPEIVKANVHGLQLSNRGLSGMLEVIDQTGIAQNVTF
ncbi:MAG: hypothetical protein ACYC4K_07345 [Thiobacillus sp.]